MPNTSVQHAGTGAKTTFDVPFPYISSSDLVVTVDYDAQTLGTHYTVPSAGTVQFVTAPANGALVEIKRSTSVDSRLVDFQTGAILTESELDLDSKQAFFLCQELTENYANVVDAAIVALATANGIVLSDPEDVLQSMVQGMLAEEAAATLQARVADIDANTTGLATANSNITTLQSDVTTLQADTATNGSAIITIQSDISVIQGDVSTAQSDIIAAQSDIATAQSDISTAQGDITTLEAKYGVTLNVNGYITGFAQFNNGTSGTFAVLADQFYIVDPANNGQNPVIPFAVSGGVVSMQNVEVSGSLVAGTLTGNKIQTSSSGKRIVLDDTSNEAEFYGDRGDTTIVKLAGIGIGTGLGFGGGQADNVIGYFGSADSHYTSVLGRTNDGVGVAGQTETGVGLYGLANNTAGVGCYLSAPDGGIPLMISPNPGTAAPSSPDDGMIYLPAGTGGEIHVALNDSITECVRFGLTHEETATLSPNSSVEATVPLWAREIIISISDMSTDGVNVPVVQLKVGASWIVAGYSGTVSRDDGISVALTSGFSLETGWSASEVAHGVARLVRVGSAGDYWAATSSISFSTSNRNTVMAGRLSVSSQIAAVRVLPGGSDTFDGGAITFRFRN